MSILSWLGLGVGREIAEPIKAVGELYTTDKARIQAATGYEEISQKPGLAQLENNRLLILSGKLFNSGWTSLIGWSCGFLIVVYYLPQILITEIIWARECFKTGIIIPFPMKSDDIFSLVYLLFGFGVHSIADKKINPPSL